MDDQDFKAKLSRAELEEMCADVFEKIAGPVEQALKSSDMTMVCTVPYTPDMFMVCTVAYKTDMFMVCTVTDTPDMSSVPTVAYTTVMFMVGCLCN